MPSLLKNVSINGFLGSKNLNVDFFDDVNFLIGKNGTGKTTFIKIVNHALSLEIAELRSFDFDEIKITLVDPVEDVRSQVKILRNTDSRPGIQVFYRDSIYSDFRRYTNKSPQSGIRFKLQAASTPMLFDELEGAAPFSQLVPIIREQIKFSWLPLLRYGSVRSHNPFEDEDEETFDRNDPINNKIEDLVSRSARYLSVLDYKSARETRDFQKNYFLSLLNTNELRSPTVDKDFYRQLEDQKEVLEEIFNELGFERSEFQTYIDKHFARLRNAALKVEMQDAQLLLEDMVTLSSNEGLRRIVDRFRQYERNKADIYRPRDNFTEIMNSFFSNKKFNFSASNEPVIYVEQSQKELSPYDLSSGERQIFVILSETLLQEGQTHIFLADEPELSLHIQWQESLVRQIRTLNPKCQLIFATHSPDLVSIHQDRVIDFDRL